MNDRLYPDLAKLFPPDHELWHHVPALTIHDAVLLSLGIDPLVDYYVPLDFDDDGNEIPPIYGCQHNELVRRKGVLLQAISANFLTLNTDKLIQKDDFVYWAKNLKWPLPAVLTEAPSGATVSQEPIQREATGRKLQKLARKALDVLQEHPNWSKSEIARRVHHYFVENPDEDFGSPAMKTIQNSLFNDPVAPFKGQAWKVERVRARRVYQDRAME